MLFGDKGAGAGRVLRVTVRPRSPLGGLAENRASRRFTPKLPSIPYIRYTVSGVVYFAGGWRRHLRCKPTRVGMTENLNFDKFSEMVRTDACEPAIIKTDRRTTHRTNSEALTYIHLEPDSGAIVLNVSDGGLAFHAVAPIHQSGIIKFWFSLHADHRIEGNGELAWTDATKKTGGLRFNSLPAEVREQIRNWVLQSGTVVKPKSEIHIAAQGRSRATPDSTPRETAIAAAESSTPPCDPPATVREAPSIVLVKGSEIAVLPTALKASNTPPVVNASAATTNKSIPQPRRSHRGSARESERRKGVRPPAAARRTALLKSPPHAIRRASAGVIFMGMLIAATALIYHQERHPAPVGLAEQFAPVGDLRAEAATNDVSLPATDPPAELTTTPISTAKSELASEISKLEAEYEQEEPRRPRPPAKSSRSVPARASSPTTSSEAASDPSLVLQPPETTAVRPNPVPDGSAGPLPAAGVPGAAEVGGPKAQTSKPQPRPQSQEFRTASRPDVDRQQEVLFSGTGKYLDVGNFSDAVWAERARDELERAGLHSLVIHKTRLWLSSYHVVVGPYADGEWVTAQEDLEARGFKPRLLK